MKKSVYLLTCALLMPVLMHAQQQPQAYIPLDSLPDLLLIMPAPPSFDSPEFASDAARYCWGKEQRKDSARLAMAIADAEWFDMEKIFARWNDAFGLEISAKGTPEIYTLLVNSITTTDPMRVAPKAHYHRQRPFERYEDSMPSHEEDGLRGEGSFPSGHSLRGWCISLILAQVAPERATAVMARGWDYCNSRVILGAHWQSDVDISRTAASAGFCALQGNPRFLAQFRKAQAEYKALRKMKNERKKDKSDN